MSSASKVQPLTATASRTRSLVFVALCVAIMAVSAWVTVPIGPVPITLQMFAIVFSILVLTPKQCIAAICCYVLLGAIGAQLRRLYYARVILSSGGGQKELMELTGLKSYPAGLTMTAARRVTDGFCQRAIELALDTDIAMKTSADEPERLLELLLVRLAQEAQHG